MESRTFETPAENRRQVAISAASCSRPGLGEAVQLGPAAKLGRAPLGFHPAPSLQAIEGRIERPFFDEQGVAGRVLDEAGHGVPVARASR